MRNVADYTSCPTAFGTGLIALDIVIGADPSESVYQWAGGTCGNVLTILSYLNWTTFPIARLNEEASSVRVKDDMRSWNVRLDFSGLAPTASVPVIAQEISKDREGKPVHKFHWRNCPNCGSWLPNYKPVTLKSVNFVKERAHKGEVFFFDRTSPGALELARYFKELGCIIFFEPSAKGQPNHFEEAIKLADIIKYSDQRFSAIVGNHMGRHRPTLEIQTFGENGLRYRLNDQDTWSHLPAFNSEDSKDTCGCGDWTTAGIISKLCSTGRRGLQELSNPKIETALKYGQALGAWNCSFEGARGGMYRLDKEVFEKEIALILQDGKLKARRSDRKPDENYASDGLCPACPGG